MGKTTRWNWDKFPHFALHCFWWIEWSHYRTMKYKPLLSDGSTWLVSGLEGFFLLPCQDTQKDGFADVRTSWELWKDLPEKRERGFLGERQFLKSCPNTFFLCLAPTMVHYLSEASGGSESFVVQVPVRNYLWDRWQGGLLVFVGLVIKIGSPCWRRCFCIL